MTNFRRLAGGLGMLYVTEGYITNVQAVEEGPEKVAATGRCYRSMRKGVLNACWDFYSGSDNYGQLYGSASALRGKQALDS